MRALTERPALLLADDMGLGKTVQAATAMARLADRGALNRALVVAPRGLLGQWRRALDVWAPGLSVIRVDGPHEERRWRWRAGKHVYLTSYETARNDVGGLRARPWDLVVLDEAQRIKNPDTATSHALKRLPRLRSWALTGTPLENRAEELASLLEFVAPNPDGAPPAPVRVGPALRERQALVQLRRRKADVLADLPPKTISRVDLALEPDQRLAYDRIEAEVRDRVGALGERATVMNVLEAITRLKQACNYCPESGRSAKEGDLVERMAQIAASGQKALVFSQWTDERFGVARVAAGLRAFRPLVYTGAMDSDEREGAVRRFNEDPSRAALVLSLRAGGQGLNLQRASYVVHFDRWWNPAVEDQATDRSHRSGQRYPVTVYEYVCADTIEERIEEILDRKRALFRRLVDGVSLDLARALTPTEIFGLLGLPAPRRLARGDGTGGAPVERAHALLRQTGWTVRSRPDGVRSVIELKAARADELGRRTELWLAGPAGDGTITTSTVEALREALPRGGEATGVVITTEPPTEDVRDAADRLGIEVWRL